MKLKKAEGQRLEDVKSLYLSAFPSVERMPFSMLLEKREEGPVRILAIESDEGEFEGMAITIESGDMALLGYFAVAADRRGGGIGSKAFRMIQELFSDKRFFLEVESTSVESENAKEREDRKVFYHENGMQDTSLIVCLKGVEMDILTRGCRITYDEYYEFYRSIVGDKIEGKLQLIQE